VQYQLVLHQTKKIKKEKKNDENNHKLSRTNYCFFGFGTNKQPTNIKQT